MNFGREPGPADILVLPESIRECGHECVDAIGAQWQWCPRDALEEAIGDGRAAGATRAVHLLAIDHRADHVILGTVKIGRLDTHRHVAAPCVRERVKQSSTTKRRTKRYTTLSNCVVGKRQLRQLPKGRQRS